MLARLPIVDCSDHGRQCPHPPWRHNDSPLSRAFVELLTSLAGDLRDIGKAARAFRVEQVLISQSLRSAAKDRDKINERPAQGRRSAQQSPIASPVRQPSLFDQHDMSFANWGIQAFRNMEMEKAVELFRKHRELYQNALDVTSRLAVSDFLLKGIQGAPSDQLEQPAYLCRLWTTFEDYVKSAHAGCDALIDEVKNAFFAHVIKALERCGPVGSSSLSGDISPGYIFLQAGRYEEAIRALQISIAETPHDAALHGYQGEAYRLRGDRRVARQCYREACLIDTERIDWRCLRDEDINELQQDLFLIYGPDAELAHAWLPSYARVNGLFEHKVVRLHDGLKQMIDDYLTLEKALHEKHSPVTAAKLFFRGIIFCENQDSLKYIKTVDPVGIRRAMKQANPDLFTDFLKMIAGAEESAVKARRR